MFAPRTNQRHKETREISNCDRFHHENLGRIKGSELRKIKEDRCQSKSQKSGYMPS